MKLCVIIGFFVSSRIHSKTMIRLHALCKPKRLPAAPPRRPATVLIIPRAVAEMSNAPVVNE